MQELWKDRRRFFAVPNHFTPADRSDEAAGESQGLLGLIRSIR
jgi:hypothetical protein